MNMFRLALRSLARNRRRSLMTLLAISLGFAAISLFAGYTHNIYDGLARSSIHGELLGHLTINKRGLRTEGKLDPDRYTFTRAEVEKISALLKDEPHIQLIAPRLGLSGLASNGRASTIFIAEGISPQAMDKLQENALLPEEIRMGMDKTLSTHLDPARPDVVVLSSGLAELLHLKTGNTGAFLVNTLSGQVNAMDFTVGGTFNTGNAGSNDKFAFVPLSLAQSLLDADGRADRLTLLLDNRVLTEPMRDKIAAKLKAAGFDVEVKTWQDLSDFYRQVHGMFDMIFGFIISIVLTVVVMSIANSMSMSVVERTREIGTLRAIGLKRRGVVQLFASEALLLSLIGCGVGMIITLLVRYAVNHSGIAYTPPNGAGMVPLLVDLDGSRIAFTLLLLLLVGTLTAYFPARRAARQQIINALGHV